jgi:ABC-2 type transport system ATP-binding protein
MIEVEGLNKWFGDTHAVDDFSFSVKKGEVLGFLGPNGWPRNHRSTLT